MIWNQRIKELRKASGITLLDVSKILDVSEATAQRYESERGIKNIPYEHIVKYSQIFQCTPSYIMGWEDTAADQADHSASSGDIPSGLSSEAIQIGLAYDSAEEWEKDAVAKLLDVKRDADTEVLDA